MPYTYSSPEDGTLHVTSCKDGVHIIAVSDRGTSVTVCVDRSDVDTVAAEIRAWARVEADR